jgi:hypothetical protein
MAWKLSDGGFKIIPEGTHIFKITDYTWDSDFGKLAFTLETANGYKHIERFGLLNMDGEVNEKANNAYSFFARTALNNPSLDEIEHSDLVGCYIEATVEHDKQPNRNDPSKTVTFVRLGSKKAASGFNKSTTTETKSSKVNLDALLG